MNSLTQHLEEQETLNQMKVVICDHDNRAYKDFRDGSGYWKHGEMRDVGVVADRMLEEIEPILRRSNISTIKKVIEVIEGLEKKNITLDDGVHATLIDGSWVYKQAFDDIISELNKSINP